MKNMKKKYDERIINEIRHSDYLLKKGAGNIWNWESAAGKIRWQRRVKLLCEKLKENWQVLELGCGTGYFTKELAKTNCKVIAVDIAFNLIKEAKKIINKKNIYFVIDNAYQMNFKNKSFNAVIGSSVLHHLIIDEALREIYRVLKPNGIIVFTEPNMLNPQIFLQKNIPYLKKMLGDSPDETAFIKWSLKKKLEKYGFKNISIVPFDFLHPAIPEYFINYCQKLSNILEKIPLIKEIAGSIFIYAEK